MRKLLLAISGVLSIVATVGAQGHDNHKEKKVATELVVVAPLRVGPVMLPAGDYKVVCDRTTITFQRKSDGRKLLQADCKGKELRKVADVTIAATRVDRNGVKFLDKLTLRGSNIEHVFD